MTTRLAEHLRAPGGRLLAGLVLALFLAGGLLAAAGRAAPPTSGSRDLVPPIRAAVYPSLAGLVLPATTKGRSVRAGTGLRAGPELQALQYARLQAGLAAWAGPATSSDSTLRRMLAATAVAGSPIRWAAYDQLERASDPSPARIRARLLTLARGAARSRAYLRVSGRFVVFVGRGTTDRCGMASRWATGSAGTGAYVVLAAFAGYRACGTPPDQWYLYTPGAAESGLPGHSFTISPVAGGLARWRRSVRDMVRSRAPWQLVAPPVAGRGFAALRGAGGTPRAYLGVLRTALATAAARTPAPTAHDPVVAAAGDIACDPHDPAFNGGLGKGSSCQQMATANLVLGMNPDAVLTLGDTQYESNALTAYQQSFDPSWGRLKSIIHPTIGNHEYLTAKAAGYFAYFGAAAGPPGLGYYSFDLSAWHLISLDSECSNVGGCGSGSPQERWLEADLAAHPVPCTLAYWHEPRFSNGEHGSATQMSQIWADLYRAHVDVVLSGHNHDYERYDPLGPTGLPDPAGVREFVVGTGGKNHYGITAASLPGEAVWNDSTYGALRLTLHPTSFDWTFAPVPGSVFTDSGSAPCH